MAGFATKASVSCNSVVSAVSTPSQISSNCLSFGHVKAEHRMDRNYLKGREGDRINAILAAAGYNFSLLLRWLADLLRALLLLMIGSPPAAAAA